MNIVLSFVFILGGVLIRKASFNDKPGSRAQHSTQVAEDFIFGTPLPLQALQSSVARMHLKVTVQLLPSDVAKVLHGCV